MIAAKLNELGTAAAAFEGAIAGPRGAPAPEALGAESGFGSMMAGMLADAAAALRTGEAKSLSAIRGETSIRDAVDAVMAAEHQLQATLAIRDKIVAAYLDLSRQQI